MKRLQLNETSLQELGKIPEAGMDYYVASGNYNDRSIQIIIRGNGISIPLEGWDEVYGLNNLNKEIKFPDEADFLEVEVTDLKSDVSLLTKINLPHWYVPAWGAHQLLGSIKLPYPTRFFRYTSASIDPRYMVGLGSTLGTIIADTYLTSFNDQQFANTGFGAVGRYALPLPIPASHLHDYTLPKGTQLLVGTVAPKFCQAGGGVEVKTISRVAGVIRNSYTPINDF